MIRVLFVCLGNICRSPLAEGIFKDLVRKRGLEQKIRCDSAGTSSWHIGDLPDPRTTEIAQSYGIILDHRGQQVQPEDFLDFNYIVAMDDSNRKDLESLAKRIDGKAILVKMRDFDALASGSNVPDPYYGGRDGFQHVYDLLSESCSRFIDFLVSKHNLSQ